MIALYIAMDSFGTACNVTGDGAIALVVNKMFGKKKDSFGRVIMLIICLKKYIANPYH